MKSFSLFLILCSAAAAFTTVRPAQADLVLSFDKPAYTVKPGQTVSVKVFVSQVAGGPQVGVGNELITANIKLTFDSPAGVAAVLADSDITAGPDWDSASASVSSSEADLSDFSIAGIADLTSPVLLGTFTFTAIGLGSTTLSVTDLDPASVDFITALGDNLDPSGGATAGLSVVPEPSTLVLTGTGFLIVARIARRRGGSKAKAA